MTTSPRFGVAEAGAGFSAGLLAVFAACGGSGTDLNQVINVNPVEDAGEATTESGTAGLAPFKDPFGGAAPYASQMGEATHNAGKSCNEVGCHAFVIGGTVYKDYLGTVPAIGVEVRILDLAGNAASVYSGPSGTFHLDSSKAITLPAVVGARDGTTTRPMITTLMGAMGSCGATNCHVSGGSPMDGAYYPIHVP